MSDQTQMYETLQVDFLEAQLEGDSSAQIARITLNRPQVLNALSSQMAREISTVLQTLEANEQVRVAILTGAGRAFCAGADLKERLNMNDEQWMEQRRIFEPMFLGLFNFSKPLLAAVNGVAFGGGCEMALACDFIVAASEAAFALPEVSRGIMPGGGGTQLLLRLVGQNYARWMMFSGARVPASEAYRVGLAQHVVEGTAQDFESQIVQMARQIAANGPLALRQLKQAIKDGLNLGIYEGFAAEIRAYNVLVPSEDRREGMRAFNEKRSPRFTGR
jgi:enoyl-CoA hydratase/carnithine racemase